MAAVEFIEKMDRTALKISEESYESFMEAAISETNQREGSESESLELSFNEKLDLAEAKAEEFFSKAKEALLITSERANQAFSSFKESSIAKKSMEKFSKLMKEFSREDVQKEPVDQGDFEEQLARAVSLTLIEDPIVESGNSEKFNMLEDQNYDEKKLKPDPET